MPLPSVRKILIIEKSTRFRRLLWRFFSRNFPRAEVKEYKLGDGCPDNTFPWCDFDLLILGFELGKHNNGLDWLKICKTDTGFPATILISDDSNEKISTEAFRYGVNDYLNKKQMSMVNLKKSIERAIKKHAFTNNISGDSLLKNRLVNRVELYKRIDQILGDGALLLICIDNFRVIHQQIGLIAADDLGCNLADTIFSVSTSTITGALDVIRINGDCIAVVVFGSRQEKNYAQFSTMLCNMVDSKPFEHEQTKIHYKVSIGMTHIKESFHATKNHIARADLAMQLAMNDPENSFALFRQNTQLDDQKLIKKISQLIKENRVKCFFQPIVNVSGYNQKSEIQIYQLRTKLVDINKQLIGYREFFPILEKNRSVRKFDTQVLACAFQILNQLKKKGHRNIGLLIPLEEASLLDKYLPQFIKKQMEKIKQPSVLSSIILEIRSEYFIISQKQITATIRKLKKICGISFALTNVTSLSAMNACICDVPFSFIKMPAYKILNSKEKAMGKQELKDLTARAKELGSLTIIDKIDNATYLSNAVECAANFVSGYLVHPPQTSIVAEEQIKI